jgi:hypothetical protein
MENYIALLSGFIGALIGSISSLAGIWIQARFQDRSTMMNLSTQLALEDYKNARDRVSSKGGYLLPLVAYVHYHHELMNLILVNKLNQESVKLLRERNKQVVDSINQYCEKDAGCCDGR